MLTVIALIVIALALGWRPTLDALEAIAKAAWDGLVFISTAPLTDAWAAIKRFALAIGVILLIASFWSPLPSSTISAYESLHTAIENYQEAHGLTVDGIWGPATNRSYLTGE